MLFCLESCRLKLPIGLDFFQRPWAILAFSGYSVTSSYIQGGVDDCNIEAEGTVCIEKKH